MDRKDNQKNLDSMSYEELTALKHFLFQERIRLREENVFFDKKMQILKSGFFQLDLDRKQFEREKKMYKSRQRTFADAEGVPYLFKGVNSSLGLKKRYKDLIKIFHPDNVCGDSDAVKEINRQYEALKRRFET